MVILRNPVDRAYSHYNHVKRWGKREPLSFEDAIKHEEKRLDGEKKHMIQDDTYNSKNFRSYSYLARGRYVEQLKQWMKIFPRNQFLILKTEDLNSDVLKTTNEVFEFINLPKLQNLDIKRGNVGSYANMKLETRKNLLEYFKPLNEELRTFLNMDFDWDK